MGITTREGTPKSYRRQKISTTSTEIEKLQEPKPYKTNTRTILHDDHEIRKNHSLTKFSQRLADDTTL